MKTQKSNHVSINQLSIQEQSIEDRVDELLGENPIAAAASVIRFAQSNPAKVNSILADLDRRADGLSKTVRRLAC